MLDIEGVADAMNGHAYVLQGLVGIIDGLAHDQVQQLLLTSRAAMLQLQGQDPRSHAACSMEAAVRVLEMGAGDPDENLVDLD